MKMHYDQQGKRTGGMLALTCLALMLCAYAPQSQAECRMGKGLSGQTVEIGLGSILVPASTPPTTGRTIAQQSFVVLHADNSVLTCSGAGASKLIGKIEKGVREPNTNRIYRTNIPGIGIRIGFRPHSKQSPEHFPFDLSPPITSSSTYWTITVELYKLQKFTGNGPLEEGVYATMYSNEFPQDTLKVVVTGRATTILTPSCTAAPTPTVQLGKVWKNLFSSVGSVAAEQPFNIKLDCVESKPELNSVYLRMDAKPDASGAPGVIALSPDANAATGFGIQILDKDRQPVAYGQSTLVGMSKNGVYDVPFHARYYQTADKVTAGVANGSATFTLEYK